MSLLSYLTSLLKPSLSSSIQPPSLSYIFSLISCQSINHQLLYIFKPTKPSSHTNTSLLTYLYCKFLVYFKEQIALTSPEVLLKDTHTLSSLEKTLTSLNYFMIEALSPLNTNVCYFWLCKPITVPFIFIQGQWMFFLSLLRDSLKDVADVLL
jgi:hypothetical protein